MLATKSSTWRIGAAFFLTLGAGLVVAATLLDLKKATVMAAVCLNLGLAILAVLLVDVMWRLIGGNPLDLSVSALDNQVRELATTTRVIERARNVGLDDLFSRQADFGTQATWEDLLRSAHTTIDIMARTSFGWSKSHVLREIIADRIGHGVTIRWLIMSRDNRYLPLLEQEDASSSYLLDGKLTAMDKLLRTMRASLSPADKEKFQVHTYDHVPLYCALLRVDDRWFVTQYLFSRSSDECPLICARGENSTWGTLFRDEFEFIWTSSQPLPDTTAEETHGLHAAASSVSAEMA